ncbi:hypothetical protein O3M35_007112 [Rhynocoris fuscipes]|uniref:Odorant receptor n=1 Tax=Rhynocoris fuscipes TaxID=488301 RepID=A0AAW1DFB0_9HEMI
MGLNRVNVFSRHVYLLRYLGIAIQLNETEQNWSQNLRFILVQIALTMNTIFQVFTMFEHKNTLVRRSVSLVIFLTSLVTQIKLILVKMNADLLGRLFLALDTPGAHDESTEMLKVVRLINRVYVTILVTFLAAWLAYPWLTGDLNLPLPYWLPFTVNTTVRYIVAYSFVSTVLVIICYTQEAVDTMLLLVAGQICRRLNAISRALQSLGNEEPFLKKYWKHSRAEVDSLGLYTVQNAALSRDETLLKESIREHVDSIRLIRTFDRVLDDIFLAQVLQSAILSTMYFFVASKSENLIRDFPKLLTVLLATYLQFYMYCWLGEEISQHNDDIHRMLYLSNWYKCRERIMKSLVIIETFTKTKFKLEGGHLFRIDLRTFVMVLQESISYFMVLRAVLK